MTHPTELLIWGLVAHLAADWLLQNDWMATYKGSLKHPAAWVHSEIYALTMMLVFPWPVALLLGLTHMVIDTRKPLRWWRETIRQIDDGSVLAGTVAIWNDQALHILLIAVASVIS